MVKLPKTNSAVIGEAKSIDVETVLSAMIAEMAKKN